MTTLPRFGLLKEQQNLANGENEWHVYGSTSNVNIIDLTITTTLEANEVASGTQPQIIPLGPKDRICKLVGSFDSDTITGGYVANGLDVIQEGDNLLGLGVYIIGDGIPEMSGGWWKIKEFTWNREAKKRGKYEFSMTLGYIWRDKSESQLWKKGAAEDTPEVRFTITNGSNVVTLIEPKIFCSLLKMNEASFKLTTDLGLEKEHIVSIYCNTNPAHPMFVGVIKEIRNTSTGTAVYSLKETAIALHEIRCMNPKPGIFKPRQIIRNPYEGRNLTINEMANVILKQNFKGHSTIPFNPKGVNIKSTYASSQTLPGRKNVKIPNQILSGCSVATALDNFLVNQCGMHVWYDGYNSTIEAGYVRDNHT
jgi:hypothetical protein